jgi:hypothetical protein
LAKQWHDESNYIVILAVRNKEELSALFQKANIKNIKCVYFCEPDINNGVTAIVLAPGLDSRLLTGHIKLMGKENA